MSDPRSRTLAGRPRQGRAAERRRRTSLADVEAFTAITGDRNPLHYDAALAAASASGGLILQRGVTSGLLNAVVAEARPARRPSSSASNGASYGRCVSERRSPRGSR